LENQLSSTYKCWAPLPREKSTLARSWLWSPGVSLPSSPVKWSRASARLCRCSLFPETLGRDVQPQARMQWLSSALSKGPDLKASVLDAGTGLSVCVQCARGPPAPAVLLLAHKSAAGTAWSAVSDGVALGLPPKIRAGELPCLRSPVPARGAPPKALLGAAGRSRGAGTAAVV
jgi:hypothetical protein